MREQTRLEIECGARKLAEIQVQPVAADTPVVVVAADPVPAPAPVEPEPAPAPDTVVKLAEPVADTPEVAAKKARVRTSKVEEMTPDNTPKVTQ